MDPDAVANAIVEEHRQMADTLEALGPDAPTLLEGWTTGDLAAHLASLMERGGIPVTLARVAIQRWYTRPTTTSRRVAERSRQRAKGRGFEWAVAKLRGPHPRAMLGRRVAPLGIFEIWVHHEDVLRAQPAVTERAAPDELATCLPWLVRFHARRLDGVELVAGVEGEEWRAGTGAPVVVSGDLGEVVLWLAGRAGASHVEVEGDPAVLGRVSEVTGI